MRRRASRGSYTVLSTADLLLDPLRSRSAIASIIRTPPLCPKAIRLTALQHHDLRPHIPLLATEQREGVARLAPPVGGTPGVEQHEAVFVLEEGDVGVTEDHYACVREAVPHARPAAAPGAGVVDHAHPRAPEPEFPRLGEICSGRVEVPPDRLDGRVRGELVEERRGYQISRVQDEVGALEVRGQGTRQSPRPAGDVGIGDDDGEGAHPGGGWVAR